MEFRGNLHFQTITECKISILSGGGGRCILMLWGKSPPPLRSTLWIHHCCGSTECYPTPWSTSKMTQLFHINGRNIWRNFQDYPFGFRVRVNLKFHLSVGLIRFVYSTLESATLGWDRLFFGRPVHERACLTDRDEPETSLLVDNEGSSGVATSWIASSEVGRC